MNLQPLFDHLKEEHGLTLVESELFEIVNIVNKDCPGWIDVNDQLPKERDYFSILVYGSYTRDCPQRPTEVHYYWRGKNIEFRNMDGSRTKNVTHWMPLPKKPIK